jgi:inhibitor of KinA
MKLVPLGDQAVLAYLPDETAAIHFAACVRAEAFAAIQDVVPAYASVGVFFDADAIGMADVLNWLGSLDLSSPAVPPREPGRLFRIPVCYEMEQDMSRVCEHTGLDADHVIRMHTSSEFTVCAIGFVPGFPYLGYLPPPLCGVGRLPSPRARVEPGSVGLTGRQTGIYPLARPGGWNLIGRTPRIIVDVAEGYFPLRVGDAVRFERIDALEFAAQQGERLDEPLAREQLPSRVPRLESPGGKAEHHRDEAH